MIQIEKITEWATKQIQTAGISIKQHPLLIVAFFIIFAPVGGVLAWWLLSHDIATAYKDRDLYKDCLDQGLSCKQIRDLKTVTVYKNDPAQTAELNALREALDKIKCAPSTPSTETPRPTQNKIGVDDQSLWPNIIIDNAYAQDTVDENGKVLLLAAANVHNDSNTNASVERQFTIATLTKPTSKLEYYISIYKKNDGIVKRIDLTIKTSDEQPSNLLIKGRTNSLNADEINNFNQNNMPLYFFGFLEYKDEKGKQFRQAFGLQIKHNSEWVLFGACDYNYRIEIDKNKKICE